MNGRDVIALTNILADTEALLNAGPSPEGKATILNIDVLEALIGDVRSVMNRGNPHEVAALLKQDRDSRK